MKILVFSDWFYPGSQAGGPIQSLISLMKFSSDNFFVVTRNTDLNSTIEYPSIKSNIWQQSFQENIQVYYLNENSLTENLIFKIYKEVEPDRVYLNSMWSPKFTLTPLKVCRKNSWSKQVVLAPRGMLKPAAFKQKGFKKKLFVAFAKMSGTYGNIIWHATSEIEKNEILNYFPNAVVRIAPNISNTTFNPTKKERSNPFCILTIARISHEKGYLEAVEAMRKWNPNQAIQWDIVGLKEDDSLVQSILDAEKDFPLVKVQIHGHKNQEELKPFLEKSHLFFLPSRGENYGHAIAEALSFGMPVLISDQTPWKNMEQTKAGIETSLNAWKLAEALTFFQSLSEEEYMLWSAGALKYAKLHVNSPETLAQNRTLFK